MEIKEFVQKVCSHLADKHLLETTPHEILATVKTVYGEQEGARVICAFARNNRVQRFVARIHPRIKREHSSL